MAGGSPDVRVELADIAASLRAHLEVEAEIGGAGVPHVHAHIRQPPSPLAFPSSDTQVPSTTTEEPPSATAPEVSLPPRGPPPAVSAAHGELTGLGASLNPEERRRRLSVLADEAAACTACMLHEGRTKNVFARGSAQADLVFVGEGPGRDEDRQGLPFVGRAGQLLDRMIAAMGYERDEVYVCNVVKCRPPENRTPKPDEAAACERFLVGQLELVDPKVIVALGKCAASNLECVPPKGRWRGNWRQWRGVPVMPTYHPAFLLRSPEFKRPVWEDLQHVMRRLGKEPPRRKR